MEKQKTKSQVILYLYDLSGGLAKTMSPMFLGMQIEAIWHTSIVIYGWEYFYGGGIAYGKPKQTMYGHPIKEENVGETEISQSEFHEFLRNISGDFTPEKYHILNHNCNHFTDECLQFLLGKQIPAYVKNLPSEVMQSPIGILVFIIPIKK